MIEKPIVGLLKAWRAWVPRARRCIGVLPAGAWVAVAVVVLVGGRALWVAGLREPRREEIAAAFGSMCLFDGCAQPDPAGTRVCYVRVGHLGREEYVLDVRTDEKQKFRGGRAARLGLKYLALGAGWPEVYLWGAR